MPTTLDYTATYDPTTAVGRVRKAIQDIDVDTTPPASADETPRNQWSCLFVDQEIQVSLDQHIGATNQIDLAAADLLDEIASSNALIARLITLGEYTSDTRTTASALRAQADRLRQRESLAASAGSDAPAEAITDEAWTDFDTRREFVDLRWWG